MTILHTQHVQSGTFASIMTIVASWYCTGQDAYRGQLVGKDSGTMTDRLWVCEHNHRTRGDAVSCAELRFALFPFRWERGAFLDAPGLGVPVLTSRQQEI